MDDVSEISIKFKDQILDIASFDDFRSFFVLNKSYIDKRITPDWPDQRVIRQNQDILGQTHQNGIFVTFSSNSLLIYTENFDQNREKKLEGKVNKILIKEPSNSLYFMLNNSIISYISLADYKETLIYQSQNIELEDFFINKDNTLLVFSDKNSFISILDLSSLKIIKSIDKNFNKMKPTISNLQIINKNLYATTNLAL